MAYYTDLFSPETYEAFSQSQRNITGFRMRHLNAAKRIKPGDKLVCYMTKLSRWVGVLEVQSDCFLDETPIFQPEEDPFVVRFKVKVIAWLEKEKGIPIHEDVVWNELSFTKKHEKGSKAWTGKVRGSLVPLSEHDGSLLEELILSQEMDGKTYAIDEDKYKTYVTKRIRSADKEVAVTVPEDSEPEVLDDTPKATRDSTKFQALLASIGERMGFRIWLPKQDRTAVLGEWQPRANTLLDILPLNYDEMTLRTIEQIDVLWLKGRAIVRAFEVEHTTAVYSGILRMADLLALQPNMAIKLHIVAPEERKEKVFSELRRPVFSLLDRGPLYEHCTFLSYHSLQELSKFKHLNHLSDDVLEEYSEPAE